MQTTPGTPLTSGEPDADESAEHDQRQSRRPELRLWLGVVVAVYVLDQLTKRWAERALSDGQPRHVVGDLIQLRLAHNAGAAFSTGTSYTVVLTLIALTVIVICLRMAGRLRSRGWAVALGLVVGGALGNVTDRLFRDPSPFRGHVVDFIEFPHWPIFNIADSAITIAAALFVWLAYRGIRLDGSHG
jgi:signal peptidase II